MKLSEFLAENPDAMVYFRDPYNESHFSAEEYQSVLEEEGDLEANLSYGENVILGPKFEGQFISIDGNECWVVL